MNAILAQEIGWFDDCGAGELSTRVAEVIGKIQDGIGRKVGDSIQYTFQVFGSIGLGFYLDWRVTLVMLAVFPLVAGTGKEHRCFYSTHHIIDSHHPRLPIHLRQYQAPS